MNADTVLSLLPPKVEKQSSTKRNGKAKDPRIGVTLSSSEIRKFGRRIV